MPEPSHLRLLGPWRRLFQWLCSLIILGLPFGAWQGRSLLRLDIDSLSLHLAGQVLRLEDLHLVLFASLLLVIVFLLVTMVFGRVWCGWACPQTTLTDLAEWWSRKLGLKVRDNRLNGAMWRKVLAHCGFALLALLVGANLVWYFVDPYRFFAELATGGLHPGAIGTWLVTAILVYADLGFVRRLVCRDFCPYGRFQTVLADRGTLVLHRPDSEAPRCIECGACVRACPMGIDIRKGYQVECINCGRCLDACRQVMARLKQPGLMVYSFGTGEAGWRSVANPRTALLSLAVVLLAVILAFGIFTRQEASLKVAVSHTAASRLDASGRTLTFFDAWVGNRGDRVRNYHISASTAEGVPLEVRGQTRDIQLLPGENQAVSFVLLTPAREKTTIVLSLADESGRELARQEAIVLPAAQSGSRAE